MISDTTFKWFARSGYAARGVVYVIIAIFALLAAIGSAETRDSEGALQVLLAQPFGAVLLGLVAAGLIAHSIWRLLQALFDVDGHGTDIKGLGIRAGLFGSSLIHAALALFAVGLILGRQNIWGDGGGSSEWLSRTLNAGLGSDAGAFILLLAPAVPLIVGLAHLYKAWKSGFEKYLTADGEVIDAVRPFCQFGLAARGVVFLIIAGLLFYLEGTYDPENAPGLKDALVTIQGFPFGQILLLVMAAGLLSFAVYSFVQAIYRRIQQPEPLKT